MNDRRSGYGSSILTRGRLKASELFPLFSRRRASLSSAFVVPALLTVVVVVFIGTNSYRTYGDLQTVIRVVALWLSAVGLCFFHVLCGRVRPLWWTAAAFGISAGLLWLDESAGHPFLVGFQAQMPDFPNSVFLDQFSNTALSEESFKGLQIAAMALLGRNLSPSIRRRLGINTPIQGALWGAAVGAGFNLVETFDYVDRKLDATVPSPIAAFVQLLVRMLGQVSMHAAWTGITGYYIGLGVLTRRGLLGFTGLLIAAALHAAWNTNAGEDANVRLMFVVGAVSYVIFAASVLKGLQLASRIGSDMLPAPAPAPGVVVAPAAEPVAVDPAALAPVVPHVRTIAVRLGPASMRLRPGDTIRRAHAPDLQPSRGDDVVGEVVANPSDPDVWGLRNLSLSTWAATVRPGQDRQLGPGYSILLEPGIVIHLGDVTLVVGAVISAPEDRP